MATFVLTDKDILSSLVSNADNGVNNNAVVKENNVPPSQLTTDELKEAIGSILRTALYNSEHGLET